LAVASKHERDARAYILPVQRPSRTLRYISHSRVKRMLQCRTSVLESGPGQLTAYRYFVYGMTLQSEIPLALPKQGHGELGQIDLRIAPASHFSEAARSLPLHPDSESFYQTRFLPDGSTYVRWDGVGEFMISPDGRQITGRQNDEAHEESFQVYLLGQALSYALVKQGFEPLHATAIVVNGEAAVLLGNSGFGKSSLAACFLDAGHRLLTDDLLILRPGSRGVLAYPGPPRIKLFPKLARRFHHEAACGVAMNLESKKLILPLDHTQSMLDPVPIKGIYALLPPRATARQHAIRISVLPPRESFIALVKNTFNYRIVTPARLQRQFEAATRVVSAMPVKKVAYPRILARLPDVRDALLADMNSTDDRQAACGY
jgi:hypothetical protein